MLGRTLQRLISAPVRPWNHSQSFIVAQRASSGSACLSDTTGGMSSSAPTVLLVESPTKARKIQEYVGDSYRVLASYGHIRDLPAKAGSVVPENGFDMRWELTEGAW